MSVQTRAPCISSLFFGNRGDSEGWVRALQSPPQTCGRLEQPLHGPPSSAAPPPSPLRPSHRLAGLVTCKPPRSPMFPANEASVSQSQQT